MGNLNELRWLLLNRNNLEGDIPEELENLERLQLFYIEDNNIESGLDIICDINPSGSSFLLKPEIVSDCHLCETNFTYGCCNECCSDLTPCSDRSHVPDMDPFWQVGYSRSSRDMTFDKEDWFTRDDDE